jgi:hypothetical protein
MRSTVRAVSAKESAHADHASDAAVRALILPTPRPCVLAPFVSIPFYSTAISQTLRGTLSEPERAETLTAHLLRTQAMYACIHETGAGFFEGGVQVRGSVTYFSRPTPYRADIRECLYASTVHGYSHRSESQFTAQNLVPGSKSQGRAIGYSSPLYRRSYAGSRIWTSENSILVGTWVNKT